MNFMWAYIGAIGLLQLPHPPEHPPQRLCRGKLNPTLFSEEWKASALSALEQLQQNSLRMKEIPAPIALAEVDALVDESASHIYQAATYYTIVITEEEQMALELAETSMSDAARIFLAAADAKKAIC